MPSRETTGSSSADAVPVRNRGGRPRASEQSTPLSIRLPNSYFDKLTELAIERGESVSAVVKQLLVLRLK